MTPEERPMSPLIFSPIPPEEAQEAIFFLLKRAGGAYRGEDALGPDDLALAHRVVLSLHDAVDDEILDAGIPTEEIEEYRNRSTVQRCDAALLALHLLPALLRRMYLHLLDLAGGAEHLRAKTIDTEHRAEIERLAAGLSLDARQAWCLANAIDGIEPR